MNNEFVRAFIQQNGHHDSGYYKHFTFKTPVNVLAWDAGTRDFTRDAIAIGMYVEDDIAPCGHYCNEPFIIFDDGTDAPVGDVLEIFHHQLESALSEGDVEEE